MQPKYAKLFVALLSLAGTTIAFQNCSDPGFQAQLSSDQLDSNSLLSAPQVTFMSSPETVNSSSVSLSFDIVGSTVDSVMCSLNGEASQDCFSKTVTYSNLADGDYTLDVVAKNSSGATGSARKIFRKDSRAPVITVTMTPAASTSLTTAGFVFSVTDNLSSVAFVQCSLDSAAFTNCTSPQNLSNLSVGTHNFRIQAQDNAHNLSAVYSYSWTVTSAVNPLVNITAPPASFTNSTSISLSFTGSEVVSYECQIDALAFTVCISPQNYSGLIAGVHTFRVRGVTATGARSAEAVARWTVDLVAPSAPNLIASIPATTNSTSASFNFSSTDASGIASYQCSLDSAAYTTCTSPRALTSLAQGAHNFRVRSVDNANNSSSESSFAWSVDSVAPTLAFTQTPAASTTATTAAFAFSATDSGSGISLIQCSLDNAAFQNCTSPLNLTALSVAAHTFRVQVRDNSGNVSLISHSWSVTSATPPPPTPGMSSYDLMGNLAALPSEFSALSLPAAPVTTRSLDVDTEAELINALTISGADITVLPKASGGCYVGNYTTGASDQRIRFRAGACLVASNSPATSYAQANAFTVSGIRIHMSGPGGITGGSFYLNARAQDIRMDGRLVISTKRDSINPDFDQIHIYGTRILMEGMTITSRTYCSYSNSATDLVIANSSLVSHGGEESCLRIVGGIRVVVMDNRLVNPTHHTFRVHSAGTTPTRPSDLVYFARNQLETGGIMSNNSAGNPDPQALRTWYVNNYLYGGGTVQVDPAPQNISPIFIGNSVLRTTPPPAWQMQ